MDDRASSLDSAGTRTLSSGSQPCLRPSFTINSTGTNNDNGGCCSDPAAPQINNPSNLHPNHDAGFSGSIDRRTLRTTSSATTRNGGGGATPSTTTTTLVVAGHHKTSGASSNVYNGDATDLILSVDEDDEDLANGSGSVGTGIRYCDIEAIEQHLDAVTEPSRDSIDYAAADYTTYRFYSGQVASIFHTPDPSMSLCCNRYIEDQDPEWRDLDYGADVGPPPETLCQFIRQYDWGIFKIEGRLMNQRSVFSNYPAKIHATLLC